MALGRKTGGRNFEKGAGGRPKGAKDKFPRSARKAVDALLEKFGNDVDLIDQVLRRGLNSRPTSSFPYLRLVIEQNAGAPDRAVNVRTVVVHEHHKS